MTYKYLAPKPTHYCEYVLFKVGTKKRSDLLEMSIMITIYVGVLALWFFM